MRAAPSPQLHASIVARCVPGHCRAGPGRDCPRAVAGTPIGARPRPLHRNSCRCPRTSRPRASADSRLDRSGSWRLTPRRAGRLLLDWHPTRREMLITTAFDGNTFQIHSVAGPGMDRQQLTFFPTGAGVAAEQCQRRLYSPDGSHLVFNKDSSSGGETMQLFRFDLATKKTTLLTDGKSRNGVPVWSHRSRAHRLRLDAPQRARWRRPRHLGDEPAGSRRAPGWWLKLKASGAWLTGRQTTRSFWWSMRLPRIRAHRYGASM